MVVETKLYDILGVKTDSSEKDITTAFRKLSRQHHPDKFLKEEEKIEATKRFQEINEAHDVLSNVEKRRIYDQVGMNGLKNMNGGNNNNMNGGFPFPGFPFGGFGGVPPDIFNMFGGGMQRPPHTQMDKKIKDCIVHKDISLEQLYKEEMIGIEYIHTKKCEKCNGHGTKDGKQSTCSGCNGNGQRIRIQQNGNMIIQNIEICNECGGKGSKLTQENKCNNNCEEGLIKRPNMIHVKLSRDSVQHVISGLLEDDAKLIIVLNVLRHKDFIRNDKNLFLNMTLTLREAVYGFKKEITLLDDSSLEITSNDIIQPETVKIVKDKGFMKGGDLYIRFKVILERYLDTDVSNTNLESNLVNCDDIFSEHVRNELKKLN